MESKFIDLLADVLEMDANEIRIYDKFREYKNWDSLSHLAVIVMMDEEFEVQIEANDLRKMATVGDLLNAVTKN